MVVGVKLPTIYETPGGEESNAAGGRSLAKRVRAGETCLAQCPQHALLAGKRLIYAIDVEAVDVVPRGEHPGPVGCPYLQLDPETFIAVHCALSVREVMVIAVFPQRLHTGTSGTEDEKRKGVSW